MVDWIKKKLIVDYREYDFSLVSSIIMFLFMFGKLLRYLNKLSRYNSSTLLKISLPIIDVCFFNGK